MNQFCISNAMDGTEYEFLCCDNVNNDNVNSNDESQF